MKNKKKPKTERFGRRQRENVRERMRKRDPISFCAIHAVHNDMLLRYQQKKNRTVSVFPKLKALPSNENEFQIFSIRCSVRALARKLALKSTCK